VTDSETIDVLVAGGPALRAALLECFAAAAGFQAAEAASAGQALERMEARNFGVLLACEDLAGEGSEALLQSARAAGFSGAAILLAHGPGAEERGFDAAFDLPVRFSRLISCIRACTATRDAPVSGLALGEQVFCEATQTLAGPEGARALTEKETAIFARLARAKGDVVSRDALLREIWGYNSSVATRTLETHIHRLRLKIESTSRRPQRLLTAPGGYRLATDSPEEM
jgi:DNA-binding response OmpR family regulator